MFSIYGAVAQKWMTLGGAFTDQRPVTDTMTDGTGSWSHLADNSWIVAGPGGSGTWIDGQIFSDWYQWRNCIGYPTADTRYNQDNGYWSIFQPAQWGGVGYAKGKRIVFRSDGHRLTDPNTCR
jgi:hypothetical protein